MNCLECIRDMNLLYFSQYVVGYENLKQFHIFIHLCIVKDLQE